LLHIDTGHNFAETLRFRDRFASDMDCTLLIRRVQDSIDRGRVREETGPSSSRNILQTVTLLDAIKELDLDAAVGGARRDEEKARAKERIFSHRDVFGQWDPKNQRPELWNLYNGRKNHGEHFRVFPLSNWTELDIWHYIAAENIPLPDLYFAHQREVVDRGGTLLARTEHIQVESDERVSAAGCVSARSATRRAPEPWNPAPRRSQRSSWKPRPPASPSEAGARTTSGRIRRWKTENARVISNAPRRRLWRRLTCSASPPPAAWMTARAR
jgi:sulfate adenylyltransferase small subunit